MEPFCIVTELSSSVAGDKVMMAVEPSPIATQSLPDDDDDDDDKMDNIDDMV